VSDALNTWFIREILVHEAALVRYLTRIWPKRDEIHDLRQDIYVRVYEAAAKSRPGVSSKTFLFQTARNLMIDRLRRARIVSIEAISDPDALNVLVDEVSPERRVGSRQELKRFAHALSRLPPRCREVIWLRRVDEIAQKEVAEQLGISVRTVEVHVLNGMRLLAESFLNQNGVPGQDTSADFIETGAQHGQQAD
jgi:RNA polymerase sigma factor (sigma-70 family)